MREVNLLPMLTIIAAAIVVDRNHGMSHLPHLCRRHLPHLTFNLSSDYDPGRPPMPPPPPGESAAGVSGSPEGGAPSSSSFSSPPIRVMLDRRVTDVTEVDDKERTVTVQLVTYKMWKEPRIVTDRITFLSEEFFRKCVWSPTFVHLNLHASENFNLAKNPNIYGVDEESHIMLVSYNMITVGCTMHFTMYPFDTQECDVLEIPMELNASALVMEDSPVAHEAEHQRELQYWVRVEQSRTTLHDIGGYKFSASGMTIKLKRRLSIHVMETYVPTMFFVIASWISFLIPPEVVPGRMGMLVTLLLVQVNIALRVSSEAPRTPDVTALSLWCLLCILQVMAATVQYGFLLHMSRLGLPSSHKELANSAALLDQLHKTAAAAATVATEVAQPQSPPSSPQAMILAEVKLRQQRIDKISFAAFPAASFCLTFGYWGYFFTQWNQSG